MRMEPFAIVLILAALAGASLWYANRDYPSTPKTPKAGDAAIPPTMRKSPAALCERINNPGCIRYNPSTNWLGSDGEHNGFVVFTSPMWGIRAMAITLRTYRRSHDLKTIREIITRWAPPSENNTELYISIVAGYVGMNPSEELRTIAQYSAVIAGMIRMEIGHQPYPAHTISLAVERAQIV